MNIVLRKLIHNDSDIHLIKWNEKPCFMVSEISNALDGIGRDDIQIFLRHNDEVIKGVDYDVIQGSDARILRDNLKDSGVEKRFVHTMLIYLSGLAKYLNYRRVRQVVDFCNYLQKSKIYLNDDVPNNKLLSISVTEPIDALNKNTADDTINSEDDSQPNNSVKIYSDFLKHIALMDDFVTSINNLNIPSDKSIAFTKDMTKFLEDNGLQLEKLLTQIKKWIV